MKYLKHKQHYIDCYDLGTIEECLWWYWRIKEDFEKERNNKDFKKYSDKKFNEEVHKAVSYMVNTIKGERFKNKNETIKRWMDGDKKTQDKFDNASPPEGVECQICESSTKVTSKDLMDIYSENERVLFMFECIECKKRQALYEDGTRWIYKPAKCPKCDTILQEKTKHEERKITTFEKCKKCGYKNKDVYDFKKSDKEWKEEKERERKLLEEYRDEFCYNEKDGHEYIQSMASIKLLIEQIKGREQKQKDPVYQKAMKLKKLKISEVKKRLKKALKKQGFENLQFGKPEMDKYVIVDFTVEDTNDDREKHTSRSTCKRVIKKSLANTTWRLMSAGIDYRLGILSGRLKAYEREEDLIKLVKKRR